MNIRTSNGMGLKPTGMQLKSSNGMGIKTQNGMGINNSKGMGLSSENNYFKFDEYNRMRRYFFGDRGKGSKPNQGPKPPPKPVLKKQPSTRKPVQRQTLKDGDLQHQTIGNRKKSVAFVTPESASALPGNSVNSMKRMLKMFGG